MSVSLSLYGWIRTSCLWLVCSFQRWILHQLVQYAPNILRGRTRWSLSVFWNLIFFATSLYMLSFWRKYINMLHVILSLNGWIRASTLTCILDILRVSISDMSIRSQASHRPHTHMRMLAHARTLWPIYKHLLCTAIEIETITSLRCGQILG